MLVALLAVVLVIMSVLAIDPVVMLVRVVMLYTRSCGQYQL